MNLRNLIDGLSGAGGTLNEDVIPLNTRRFGDILLSVVGGLGEIRDPSTSLPDAPSVGSTTVHVLLRG